jgi:excisionase family DNA binding protein
MGDKRLIAAHHPNAGQAVSRPFERHWATSHVGRGERNAEHPLDRLHRGGGGRRRPGMRASFPKIFSAGRGAAFKKICEFEPSATQSELASWVLATAKDDLGKGAVFQVINQAGHLCFLGISRHSSRIDRATTKRAEVHRTQHVLQRSHVMQQAPRREYKEVYTAPEVAKLFGVGRNTVYDACNRKEIPHLRVGSTVRIPGWYVREQLEPPTNAA